MPSTNKERTDMDYSKLKGKIVERFGSATKFANAMGMSDATLSQRLQGTSPWKVPEIAKAAKLLEIKRKDVLAFFLPESEE